MPEKKIDLYTILASSVHDMKNSLTLLLAMIENITEECIPVEHPSHGSLLKVRYEANRVNNDLVQFLALYRIGNSQYRLNVARHNLNEFLVLQMLEHRPLLDFKGIDVHIDCHEDLTWYFDRDLISGALNNVLNNLYRYAKDKVRISAKRDEDYLVISIEDNGEGYPQQLLADNQEADRVLDFTSGRTGLGIYFASAAAESHKNGEKQGFISMSNGGVYGGACFSINLPAQIRSTDSCSLSL